MRYSLFHSTVDGPILERVPKISPDLDSGAQSIVTDTEKGCIPAWVEPFAKGDRSAYQDTNLPLQQWDEWVQRREATAKIFPHDRLDLHELPTEQYLHRSRILHNQSTRELRKQYEIRQYRDLRLLGVEGERVRPTVGRVSSSFSLRSSNDPTANFCRGKMECLKKTQNGCGGDFHGACRTSKRCCCPKENVVVTERKKTPNPVHHENMVERLCDIRVWLVFPPIVGRISLVEW